MQRELFEDIATKFLKSQVKTEALVSFDGKSRQWKTLEQSNANTQFSEALINSVIAVIADEFKK